MRRLLAVLAAAAVLTSAPAHAATVTVVNLDGAGEGFNDTTPAAPVGGNSGTTLGAQRLNVFNYAASLWGAVLESSVEIKVDARFDPLFCGPTSAVLGSAGTQTVHRDFSGAQVSGTWYPQALANAQAGSDLSSGVSDISATFNSSIGTTCSFPNTWYHGLDANPPGGQIDLVSVVLHEIGHGLGFAAFTDLASGQKFSGLDDIYSLHLENHATGKIYPNMSNAERVTASQAGSNLHWVGAQVTAGSGDLTTGRHDPTGHVHMYAPSPQEPGSSVSHFAKTLTPNELMEPSYTGPNHNLVRTLQLFADLGWQVVESGVMCGDPTGDEQVSSTDALAALGVSVGQGSCALEVCDVNSTMAITATDALLILQYAVGQPVSLSCP